MWIDVSLKLSIIFLVVVPKLSFGISRSIKLSDDYELKWKRYWDDRIEFTVIARTLGYVGFGLSYNGAMKGADIVIGGIKDGIGILNDYHGIGYVAPLRDESQDYHLQFAQQNDTHTTLSFTRLLDTCDDEDIKIDMNTVKVIWAYSHTDELIYHGTDSRGAKSVNLLDSREEDHDLSKYHVWELRGKRVMPSESTYYWCDMHKTPNFNGKKHMIGYGPYLPTPEAKRHTHHIDIYKCDPPPGGNATLLFDKYISKPGGGCYDPTDEPFPYEYCDLIQYGWAIGGELTMFPDKLGFPFYPNEYYMMVVHYDNPKELSDVYFETGLNIYYQDEIREIDAAQFLVRSLVNFTQMVPPNAVDFVTTAHCSEKCTNGFPHDGINVFMILLHAHASGHIILCSQCLRHHKDVEKTELGTPGVTEVTAVPVDGGEIHNVQSISINSHKVDEDERMKTSLSVRAVRSARELKEKENDPVIGEDEEEYTSLIEQQFQGDGPIIKNIKFYSSGSESDSNSKDGMMRKSNHNSNSFKKSGGSGYIGGSGGAKNKNNNNNNSNSNINSKGSDSSASNSNNNHIDSDHHDSGGDANGSSSSKSISNDKEERVFQVKVKPGHELKLKCDLNNTYGRITWVHNGEAIRTDNGRYAIQGPTKNRAIEGRLTINNVLPEDNGIWQCHETKFDGKEYLSSPKRVIVMAAPRSVHLEFDGRRLNMPTSSTSSASAPSAMSSSSQSRVTFREKDNVSVQCVVESGNPPPRIQWYLDFENYTEDAEIRTDFLEEDKIYITRSTLRIENISRAENNKSIVCLVHHELISTGDGKSSFLRAVAHFNIEYPPSFIISRIPGFGYPIREGIKMALKCDVDANPMSRPLWVKDKGEEPVSQSEDGFLNFSRVHRNDSGWYKCISLHPMGKFSSVGYYLNVRYEPKMVQQPPRRIDATVGDKVTMRCLADGRPSPAHCWSRIGYGGSLTTVGSGQELILDRILYQEAGHYRCVAENRLGLEERRAQTHDVLLTITGRPVVYPENRTITGFTGQPLSLSVETCANPFPEKAFWVFRNVALRPGTKHKNKYTAQKLTRSNSINCYIAVLTILQVSLEDAGEFMFIVRNSKGIHEGTISLNVTQASFSISSVASSPSLSASGSPCLAEQMSNFLLISFILGAMLLKLGSIGGRSTSC